MRRYWTRAEDNALIQTAHRPLAEILRAVRRAGKGRSAAACDSRARVLGFTLGRGTWSLRQLAVEAGVARYAVKRALSHLKLVVVGTTWGRNATKRIPDEHAQMVLDFLRAEVRGALGRSRHGNPTSSWAPRMKWDACRSCGTSGSVQRERHAGNGLCIRCHSRLKYRAGSSTNASLDRELQVELEKRGVNPVPTTQGEVNPHEGTNDECTSDLRR